MAVTTFDTLKFVKTLQTAGVSVPHEMVKFGAMMAVAAATSAKVL